MLSQVKSRPDLPRQAKHFALSPAQMGQAPPRSVVPCQVRHFAPRHDMIGSAKLCSVLSGRVRQYVLSLVKSGLGWFGRARMCQVRQYGFCPAKIGWGVPSHAKQYRFWLDVLCLDRLRREICVKLCFAMSSRVRASAMSHGRLRLVRPCQAEHYLPCYAMESYASLSQALHANVGCAMLSRYQPCQALQAKM